MTKNTILIFSLLILLSCKSELRGNQKYEEDNLKGIKINGLKNFLTSDQTFLNKVVFVFDGTCSNCIMSYLEFLKDSKISPNATCLFISKSPDDYEIRYFMDKFNIHLKSSSQILHIDPKGVIFEKNVELDDYLNILLLDKDNRVVTSLNPLSSDQAKKEYIKVGFLQEDSN